MTKNKHSFTHLRNTYTLYQRGRSVENPWCFSPRWGKNNTPVLITLRDKNTGRALTLAEAEDAAKFFIDEHRRGDTAFEAAREGTRLRGNTMVRHIIDAWVAAGYPEENRERRTPEQQARQAALLKGLRGWWDPKPLVKIDRTMMGDYAEWRRDNCRTGFRGKRIVDLDLNVLCNAFKWAHTTGRVEINPFLSRPRFQNTKLINHCNEFMPQSDEELHLICDTLFQSGDPYWIVAGGLLMYLALSGQRPGEGEYLRWDAGYVNGRPEPGRRYPVMLAEHCGQTKVQAEKMAVKRLKGGVNPAVLVRPALRAFLGSWQIYSQARWNSPFFFPNPSDPKKPFATKNSRQLDKPLTLVANSLNLGERHPHSMRALFVRVMRSQGYSDGQIATELGQSSGVRMIIETYGDPRDICGDGRFDWLPETGAPCWEKLAAPPANLIHLT